MLEQGLVAELTSAEAALAAVRALRAQGYRHLHAYAPHPVPGLSEALALPRSRLPWVVGAAAVAGGVLAYGVQWWTVARDYPLRVSGFAPHTVVTQIPIVFETAVLAGAVTGFVALLLTLGLPRLWQPLFELEGFERAQIDRFFVAVSARDPAFGWQVTAAHLAALGPIRVASVGPSGSAAPPVAPALLLLACAGAAGACETRGVLVSPDPSLERMVEQPRLRPDVPTPLFTDGRAARSAPDGTVAWGGDGDVPGDRGEVAPPARWTLARLARGRDRYERFCSPCHGLDGEGQTPVARAMRGVQPPSLHAARQQGLALESIYRVIAHGYGAMGSYADVLTPDDRWSVVGYVRALQRSQRASLAALPEPLRGAAARELP
jgi:mono/diheme cytochrome c family protein